LKGLSSLPVLNRRGKGEGGKMRGHLLEADVDRMGIFWMPPAALPLNPESRASTRIQKVESRLRKVVKSHKILLQT
jgi:hypothetical protein